VNYTVCTLNIWDNHVAGVAVPLLFTVNVPFAKALYVSVPPPAVISVKLFALM
jgi:hypothetical protein